MTTTDRRTFLKPLGTAHAPTRHNRLLAPPRAINARSRLHFTASVGATDAGESLAKSRPLSISSVRQYPAIVTQDG